MDGYRIALFVHLLALVAASCASAIVHLAESKRRRAATAHEALQWLQIAAKAAPTFPIVLLVLFATGGYMVTAQHGWSWSAGWVDAGVLGVVLLFVNGSVIGRRSRAAGRALAGIANGSAPEQALPHDPLVPVLSWSNTGLAMAVVFVMATKPELAGSLIALAVGIAAGMTIALSPKRSGALVEETSAG
ncbi:MAG TPA: hypothetical protein VFS44_05355 [Gemmatimonadaceae bacterium]|nr:hypothetical protein [Gemmatimonadaceae bacterium]